MNRNCINVTNQQRMCKLMCKYMRVIYWTGYCRSCKAAVNRKRCCAISSNIAEIRGYINHWCVRLITVAKLNLIKFIYVLFALYLWNHHSVFSFFFLLFSSKMEKYQHLSKCIQYTIQKSTCVSHEIDNVVWSMISVIVL